MMNQLVPHIGASRICGFHFHLYGSSKLSEISVKVCATRYLPYYLHLGEQARKGKNEGCLCVSLEKYEAMQKHRHVRDNKDRAIPYRARRNSHAK